MPGDLHAQINATVDAFRKHVEQKLEQWRTARDPLAFREMELVLMAA